ncbi:MAG: capsule assembly Wzi family protein [Candidatus Symbiothrix sp.]|jgi:hypothetical protein|nr:capsule assembly Wzi family protein [Candidatus Symbiothrix sp.]
MDKILKICCYTLLLSISFQLHAQEKIDYRLDAFGLFGAGDYTPFWIAGNTNGIVPLKPNNAYLRGNLAWDHSFGKDITLKAGIDGITAANHTSSAWLHQLFADVSFRKIHLTLGMREPNRSPLEKSLSQGDLLYSGNARPIPEININIPEFTTIPFTKGLLQFKADFAVGKSLDNKYILRAKQENGSYVKNVLWHHKSLYFKLEDSNKKIPMSFTFGLEHGTQWGGWTSTQDFGNQPDSFKDFIRVVLGEEGGENANVGDQINVLGNHAGTIYVGWAYQTGDFQTTLYKQHYFEDKSGVEYANWRDGVWGGSISFFKLACVQKVLVEFLQTTNQSGPMHFLDYDPSLNVRGGGSDSYYNNFCYVTGWSYFGRGLGNPLLTSPEYNTDGSLAFKNNRVKSIHLGLEGKIIPSLSYRTLFTGMQSWGTMGNPFLERKDNFSALIACLYEPKHFSGWKIGIQFALDKGKIYGDNIGASLTLSKSGLIKFNQID